MFASLDTPDFDYIFGSVLNLQSLGRRRLVLSFDGDATRRTLCSYYTYKSAFPCLAHPEDVGTLPETARNSSAPLITALPSLARPDGSPERIGKRSRRSSASLRRLLARHPIRPARYRGGRDVRTEQPTPTQPGHEREAAKVPHMLRAPIAGSILGSILLAVILDGEMVMLLYV